MDQEKFDQFMESITNVSKDEIDSITLKQTAKNEYYWDIKVYFKPSEWEKGIQQIVNINAKLKQLKPQL